MFLSWATVWMVHHSLTWATWSLVEPKDGYIRSMWEGREDLKAA